MPGAKGRVVGGVAVGALVISLGWPSSQAATAQGPKIVEHESGLAVVGGDQSFVSLTGRDPDAKGRLVPAAGSSEQSGEMKRYLVQDGRKGAEDFVLDRTISSSSANSGRVGWVQTDSSLGIEWRTDKEISSWDVTLPSGKKVQTDEEHFIDNTAAESGSYLIEGSDEDGAGEAFVLTVPESSVDSVRNGAGSEIQGSAANPDQWRSIVWASFIEEYQVPAQVGGIPSCVESATKGVKYFGGDERDFADSISDLYSGEHRNFRVASAVASNWDGKNWINPREYDNTVVKETGVSHSYDKYGDLVDTAQANAEEDITLEEGSSEVRGDGVGFAKRSVKVSSANPLCTVPGGVPDIDISYDYQHDSSGYVTVDAAHDRAPMHEVLWGAADDEGDPSKPSGCLYRFENQGFIHLTDTPLNNQDILLDFNPDLTSPECKTVRPD